MATKQAIPPIDAKATIEGSGTAATVVTQKPTHGKRYSLAAVQATAAVEPAPVSVSEINVKPVPAVM